MSLIRISSSGRIDGGASRTMGLGLVVLVLSSGQLAAQGQPVANGPMFPLALWWIGACILGLVIGYGIFRNRTRTRADKNLTERATKDLYAKEERERIKSGSS